MGDIFKNKFFIILLIVACVLTFTTMGLNLTGHGSIVSDAANVIIMPFQKFADIVKESWSGFTGYFTEFNKLKQENARLTARVAELEAANSDIPALQGRINSLTAYYGLMQDHTDIEKIQDAAIISRDAGNYSTVLTINKGSFHHIEKDMPVITADGIVGYISEVATFTSKVSLFIRTSNSVGAYIKRTGQIGIAEGDFELEKAGKCRLGYLSKDTDLQVGDKIYTSGYSDIYPKDLPIGEITEIVPDPLSQTLTGYIQPAVDFSSLRNVIVILKFTREFY